MVGENEVMAEAREVEEGEIYDYGDTLGYIDDKVESVLGDFMKYFEGSICVENLGPRFGVYGSFLPTYSVQFQPITPQKSQNPRVPSDSRFSAQESNNRHQVSMIRSLNQTRVGCDKTARKSSVVGLMNSPVQVSSKVKEIPTDSPITILHTMNDHQEVKSSQKVDSKEGGRSYCCRSESERDTGGAVSPRKKAVDRVVSHKPDQPRMPHAEKQSLKGKKKLSERQPGSKELTFGDEPPISPFILEGDWIRCDKCRKWRLLPYGTKPEQLSESWLCSMLDWLPGMNRCDISEEDTTRALHASYQILILNNFQNHGGKGSIDAKAHNRREVSVKKRKLRDQDNLVTSQKQKKSKVFQTEKRESSTSMGEEKSRTRGTVTRIIPEFKDFPPINRSTVEREHQMKKYGVKCQSQAEFGMIRKQVRKAPLKQALGLGKEARTCIAI